MKQKKPPTKELKDLRGLAATENSLTAFMRRRGNRRRQLRLKADVFGCCDDLSSPEPGFAVVYRAQLGQRHLRPDHLGGPEDCETADTAVTKRPGVVVHFLWRTQPPHKEQHAHGHHQADRRKVLQHFFEAVRYHSDIDEVVQNTTPVTSVW